MPNIINNKKILLWRDKYVKLLITIAKINIIMSKLTEWLQILGLMAFAYFMLLQNRSQSELVDRWMFEIKIAPLIAIAAFGVTSFFWPHIVFISHIVLITRFSRRFIRCSQFCIEHLRLMIVRKRRPKFRNKFSRQEPICVPREWHSRSNNACVCVRAIRAELPNINSIRK